MRHLVVRRVTMLLGALLFVAAGGFAWLVHDEAALPSVPQGAGAGAGAALYGRYCASCHAAEGSFRRSLIEGSSDVRREFEMFLRDHGEASDEEDRLIVDYLASPETR